MIDVPGRERRQWEKRGYQVVAVVMFRFQETLLFMALPAELEGMGWYDRKKRTA